MLIGCILQSPQGRSVKVCIFLFGHNVKEMINHCSFCDKICCSFHRLLIELGASRVLLLASILHKT